MAVRNLKGLQSFVQKQVNDAKTMIKTFDTCMNNIKPMLKDIDDAIDTWSWMKEHNLSSMEQFQRFDKFFSKDMVTNNWKCIITTSKFYFVIKDSEVEVCANGYSGFWTDIKNGITPTHNGSICAPLYRPDYSKFPRYHSCQGLVDDFNEMVEKVKEYLEDFFEEVDSL